MMDISRPLDMIELLSTKLVVPQLGAPLVPRPRLIARLDEGLAYKVTLISAPAGFGKTTLVSEWIAEHQHRNDLPPLAWLALDSADNDPVRFWRYLFTACQAFGEDTARQALAILSAAPDPPFEALLTMLINQIARLPQSVVLALEDYHTITNPQIHESVAFFIERCPAPLHLILMTRSDPPLPLARLLARNELVELRADDLRFTLEETRTFLKMAVRFPLPEETAGELAERTEGWAAGLRLVALALQRLEAQPDVERYLASFTGSHRPILDYLVNDVFGAQPEPIQRFLLQTSILNSLSGPLCDAVTGRQDSAEILARLERTNLFVVPLSDGGQWYRYHALFAEAMQHYARQQLGGEQLCALGKKASQWYAEHGMLNDAIEAALFSQNHARAAELIERVLQPQLVQNEFHTLARWMAQLPEAVLRAYPGICLMFATAILFTSDRHSPGTKLRLALPLQIAEEHWLRQEDKDKLGAVYAFHSLVDWLQGDFASCFAYARQALALLPNSDKQWRGISLIMLGVEEMLAGRLNNAHQTVADALTFCEASENIFGILDSMLLLGELQYQQGELRQAEQLFTQVLARVASAPMSREHATVRHGRAQLGLGLVALERNDLPRAEELLATAVAAYEQFPEEDLLADSLVGLALVKAARGEIAEARQLLSAQLTGRSRPPLFRLPHVYQVRLALASGEIAAAQRWLLEAWRADEEHPVLYQEQEALALARLQMAQGQPDAVIEELESWLAAAQAYGRTRSELEIRVLLAMAYADRGDRVLAQEALLEALTRARSQGYQRLFLDEGAKMAALLQGLLPAIQQEILAAYVRALLYRASLEPSRENVNTAPGPSALVEPLSEQEQRVLRLIAAGLSNPQIADELFISVNTVKTHVKNVYAKLNVTNREEARAAARQLSLF